MLVVCVCSHDCLFVDIENTFVGKSCYLVWICVHPSVMKIHCMYIFAERRAAFHLLKTYFVSCRLNEKIPVKQLIGGLKLSIAI
jgi:hypothetical protein